MALFRAVKGSEVTSSYKRATEGRPCLSPISVRSTNGGIATLPTPSPMGGMLVHRRVTQSSMSPVPIYTPGIIEPAFTLSVFPWGKSELRSGVLPSSRPSGN